MDLSGEKTAFCRTFFKTAQSYVQVFSDKSTKDRPAGLLASWSQLVAHGIALKDPEGYRTIRTVLTVLTRCDKNNIFLVVRTASPPKVAMFVRNVVYSR